MALKLPNVEALKRVPKPVWVVVAGVVLAIVYLKMKGTGASASAGLTGGGGGGGDTTQPGGTPPSDVTTPGAPPGGNPTPDGTTSPLDGLPGTVPAATYSGPSLGPIGGGGAALPSILDPTSPEFKQFFGIPENIQTVGDLTIPAGADSAGVAQAVANNMSLVDWYKYQITKVRSAQQGTIIGESPDFLAHSPNPTEYLQNTLQGGNISMYGPNAGPEQKAKDAAALQTALSDLGLSTVLGPTTYGNTPAPSGQGGSPTSNTGATTGGARVPTTSQMLAAIKARSPGATAAQIRKTLANNLARGYTPAQIVKPRK